jgi:FlaA1/EpsC-like NDP-sugar epimerase
VAFICLSVYLIEWLTGTLAALGDSSLPFVSRNERESSWQPMAEGQSRRANTPAVLLPAASEVSPESFCMTPTKPIHSSRPASLLPQQRTDSLSSFWQRLVLALLNRLPRRWVTNYILSRQFQIVIDGLVAVCSFCLAHVLRFDGLPPGEDAQRLLFLLPYLLAARLFVNYYTGIYKRIWRYVSISDATQLANTVGVISAVLLALRLLFEEVNPLLTVPIGIIVIDFVLTTCGMLGARLLWRVACENASRVKARRATRQQRALLVGAGDAGVMAAREIARRPDLGLRVCGFVDDDAAKSNTIIQGVKVLGKTAELPRLVEQMQIDEVVITIASAQRKTLRQILELCEAVKVPVRIIPGLYEIIGKHVTISNVRPVEIEDLLGRDTIDVDAWLAVSQGSYGGRRILVTGAGGSIGRELCRQLSLLRPASIILLDKDENSVFEAERELRAALELSGNRAVEVVPVICDLRMAQRLHNVFAKHLPQVVFHAAAHKHVPLMESNAAEAVLNNICGAQRLLEVCARFNVQRCVLVSSDKAVNPTNIMGATKRVAELLFQKQALWLSGGRQYSCVRFGNVLGSRGSVVPIFREQIKNGGPITLTHPEIERYFMTIPEAAQLIVQAGTLGKRGEIFVLDMGEPVKLLDLAKDMIRLSGLALGEDIDLVFTGLRPGEKLKEELLIAEEGTQTTMHEKIFVAPPLQYDFNRLDDEVERLVAAAERGDEHELYRLFTAMGIGFRSSHWKPALKPPPPAATEYVLVSRHRH